MASRLQIEINKVQKALVAAKKDTDSNMVSVLEQKMQKLCSATS